MLIDDTESQTDKLKTAAPSTTETVQTFISLSVFFCWFRRMAKTNWVKVHFDKYTTGEHILEDLQITVRLVSHRH